MKRLLIVPALVYVALAELVLAAHWTVRKLRSQKRRHTLELDMAEGWTLLRDVWHS